MSKNVLPPAEVEGMPPRARKATAPMPRWVIVTLAILLLGMVLFGILHLTSGHGGHSMGNMQMSIPLPGRDAL